MLFYEALEESVLKITTLSTGNLFLVNGLEAGAQLRPEPGRFVRPGRPTGQAGPVSSCVV